MPYAPIPEDERETTDARLNEPTREALTMLAGGTLIVGVLYAFVAATLHVLGPHIGTDGAQLVALAVAVPAMMLVASAHVRRTVVRYGTADFGRFQ